MNLRPATPILFLAVSTLVGALAAHAPLAQDTEAARQAPPVLAVDDEARATMDPTVADLSFLTGHWTGTDGTSTWMSCYGGAEGGQLLGSSKELRDGRVVMIDFEHFYERDGVLRMQPYPFGTRSVEFTLGEFSAERRRAVFVNESHDFPQRFVYERVDEHDLRIELSGDMGGSPGRMILEFTRD